MALEELGDLVLHVIISKLGAKNAAILACVNKRFRVSASEEDLWCKFCADDLDLSVREDPSGNPVSSFKETYTLWKEAFGMYPWPLVKRVKQCWTVLKNWTGTNFPEAAKTLRKGASEAEIKELEDALGVKLPIPTKLLYRFCDGQVIPEAASSENEDSVAVGLIGGYWFYDHAVNVYLLPLRQILRDTRDLMHQLGFSNRSKCIIVATSIFAEKYFLLNCADGQLYVGTSNYGEVLPCVPLELISSVHEINDCQQADAMLLWLEEHGRRLQSNAIGIREDTNIRSISLFPEVPPLCSTAVTNGVQFETFPGFKPRRYFTLRVNGVVGVRASAVFVPELSNPQSGGKEYFFTYSIRMCLLPEGCLLDGVYFGSCQLYWRHWIIRANENVISDVSAEAVIGKYPLLRADGEEFVYESCSGMPSSAGSIEGAFTFIPGRLINPQGKPFDVEVARFPLELPAYIF